MLYNELVLQFNKRPNKLVSNDGTILQMPLSYEKENDHTEAGRNKYSHILAQLSLLAKRRKNSTNKWMSNRKRMNRVPSLSDSACIFLAYLHLKGLSMMIIYAIIVLKKGEKLQQWAEVSKLTSLFQFYPHHQLICNSSFFWVAANWANDHWGVCPDTWKRAISYNQVEIDIFFWWNSP